MPVHKIPVGHLHEDLIALEREGETAVTTVREGDYFVVTTKFHTPSRVETRPLRDITHAARLGAIEQRAAWDDPLLESFVTDGIVRGDG